MANDKYTYTGDCVKRLLDEYKKHKKLIVAVDFDDTVYDFHCVGDEYLQVLNILKRCQAQGFWIVLFTASKPERFAYMKAYLLEKGITAHSVNENPLPLPFGNHGKVYYNILLDDRAGLGQALSTLESVLYRIEKGLI